MESFCRCFGTPATSVRSTHIDIEETPSDSSRPTTGSNRVPATPDMKRRTRSLALQDHQWDALFAGDQMPRKHRRSKTSKQPTNSAAEPLDLDQAQVLARAKLAANGRQKRKRSTSSADDIFRSKKATDKPRSSASPGAATEPNTFSRFLCKHPGIAHSLCFATPVRGSSDEDADNNNSVISDSNTLNTAEDTITSTLYYEQVKLKGLQQKNPPMPLFKHFSVKKGEDISNIVANESHSSARLIQLMQQEGPPEMTKSSSAESSSVSPSEPPPPHTP